MLAKSIQGVAPGFNYFFDNLMAGFTYGLGIGVRDPGMPMPMLAGPGTFLWGGAAGTMFFADRQRDYAAILMTQQPEFLHPNFQTVGTLAMQALVDKLP